MKPGQYIGSLTAMRGIAALWVMLFHIDVSLFYRDMGALLPRDSTGLLSRGYLWVDFFFILSGFIIAHVYSASLTGRPKAKSILDYLWARFARIYPLHLLCLGLVVAIALVYPLLIPGVEDGSWKIFMAWRAIPSNLLMTHAMDQHVYLSWDIVSWSIGAEWWTYVLAVPLIAILPRLPAPAALAIALAAFALLAFYVTAQPEMTLDITYKWGFVRCLLEFIIGACLWRCPYGLGPRWLGADLTLLALLAAIALLFHANSMVKGGDLLAVPMFALLLYGLCRNQGIVDRLLNRPLPQYLGRISYSLYLVHGVVFSAFWFVMPMARIHLGNPGSPLRWFYAAGFITLAIGAAHLVHHQFERPARLYLLSKRRL
jgi:peptidoglycan/LPS O-acetylase OafA/YrhL